MITIEKRHEENGVVIESEDAIRRENLVIDAIDTIVTAYIGRSKKDDVIDFVENL